MPRPPSRSRLAVVAIRTLAILTLSGAATLTAQDGTIDLGFADLGLYGPDREVRLLRDSTSHPALGWALHTGQVTPTTTGAYAWVDSAGAAAGVCDLADLSTVITRFEGYVVRVDDSGRILVGGWYSSELSGDAHLAVLVRFVPGGLCEVDTTWGGGGVQVGSERCLAGQSCRFVDVAYPAFPSGRVYALLETGVNQLVSRFFVVALSSGGDLVHAFGDDGFAEVAGPRVGTLVAGSARLEADSSGRPIVFFADFDADAPLDVDAWLARFTPTGELDPAIGGDGMRLVAGGDTQDTFPSAFALAADRARIAFRGLPTSADSRVEILEPNLGSSTARFLPGAAVPALAVQGDGKLLVVVDPTVGDGFSVCRFSLLAGAPNDTTFAGDGCAELDVDFGGAFDQTPRTLLLDAGRPLVSGLADSDVGEGLFEIRLNNALIFADGFEGGDAAAWD